MGRMELSSDKPARQAVSTAVSLGSAFNDCPAIRRGGFRARDPVLPDNRQGLRFRLRRSSPRAEESTLIARRSDNANARRRKSHGSHQA